MKLNFLADWSFLNESLASFENFLMNQNRKNESIYVFMEKNIVPNQKS